MNISASLGEHPQSDESRHPTIDPKSRNDQQSRSDKQQIFILPEYTDAANIVRRHKADMAGRIQDKMDSDFWTDNNQDDARNEPETQVAYFLQSVRRVCCACAPEEERHRLIYDWEMPTNKPYDKIK